ncbi:MAG: hypothetical protein AAB561_01550 [Patescibacteria group bacterium]
MRATFKQSSSLLTKLYIAGLSSRHKCFAPIPPGEAKRLSHFIDRKVNIPNFTRYSKCISFKRDFIFGEIPIGLKAQLKNINLRGVKYARAIKNTRDLSILWIKNRRSITNYLKSIKADSIKSFSVINVPGIGEISETLGDILILGADIPVKIGFAIFLEEFLHSVVNVPTEFKDSNLNEEAYIGLHLYYLLNKLRYSSSVVDSVVFGWQNGRRKKLVKKLIESYSK